MKFIRANLWIKLAAAFIFIALIGIFLVAILANRATSVGFQRYLQSGETDRFEELRVELADFYREQGHWNGVNSVLRRSGAGPLQEGGGYFLRVLDAGGQIVGSRGGQSRSVSDFDIELAIEIDGQRIGTLLAEPAGGGGRAEDQYLNSVNQAIIWSGLVAIFIALLLGIFLARQLTRPISRLAAATRAVASGDLSQQVPVTRADELGQLAKDFNQMANALEISERQRQQLLADTAHDLRTPISIIRSHLEAMLDGVFPTTPETLAVVYEETLHLSRLVDDVRTLSLAETRQLRLDFVPVNMSELLGQIVTSFAPLAEVDKVQLVAELPEVADITADRARLHQVLANLISNGLRYAALGDNAQPIVTVKVEEDEQTVKSIVADNGPGLTPEQQQRVFDRFWRSDTARDRQKGGSGLGLAIARSLVEAHDGTITVTSWPGSGTKFTVMLPKQPATVPGR